MGKVYKHNNQLIRLMRIKRLTATLPNTTEHDEKKQETPIIELHEEEAMTSGPPKLREDEATPLVTLSGESEKTKVVVAKPRTPPAEHVVTEEDSTVVQDSVPVAPARTSPAIDSQGKISGFTSNKHSKWKKTIRIRG